MINKAAFFEYGLIVPTDKIPPGRCRLCNRQFIIHGLKDWVYCGACNYGFSRLKLVDPNWLKSLPTTDAIPVNNYHQQVILKSDNFLNLWKTLATGEPLSRIITGLASLSEWARLVETQDQAYEFESLQLGFKSLPKPPFVVFKLEDLPGRITGAMILKRRRDGSFRTARGTLRDGQQIAFLSPGTKVVLDCFTTVLHGLLYERILGGEMPQVGWIGKEDNFPCGNLILATGELSRERVNLIANTKMKTWVNDQASKTKIRLSMWQEKATKNATEWFQELAKNLTKIGTLQSAALLSRSSVKGTDLNKILENMDPEFRVLVAPAVRGKVCTHRLPGNRVVVNSGTKWTDLSGNTVLSANLRIKDVTKINKRINYHLELIHEDWSFEFQSGLAMERNAMDVIFRECLYRQKMIEFDRRYSKLVLELATRLNPPDHEDSELQPQTQLHP